jgi:peptidoglycan/LPS O-acetylase OafA/YrhL
VNKPTKFIMSNHEHLPQLDGLRFFAILAVMVEHNWRPSLVPSGFSWGELGVRLFFVLSGFLITQILIRGREFAKRNIQQRLFFMRQFYIRRFLRIFPIYYLVLLAVIAADVGPSRHIWPWLFTYTTNIYIWRQLHWIGAIGHFWTLAVEEQFYLLWPALILLMPERCAVALLLTFICVAPVYRLYASFSYIADITRGDFASGTLPLAVLDSLGMGALLALAFSVDRAGDQLQRVLMRGVLPVSALGYLALLSLAHYGADRHALVALGQTTEALMFCCLVGSAAEGFNGILGCVLECGPIVYIGKISYGIYIFHTFVPVGLGTVARHLGMRYANSGFLNFLVSSVLTFGIASLSWHAFEAPINRLKLKFGYTSATRAAPSVAAAGAEVTGCLPIIPEETQHELV